jgi:CRP-like cAMP-binding protein
MIEKFLNDISNTTALTEAERDCIRNTFVSKKILKKQFFLQEGNIAFHTAYVASGCLRSFTTDEEGTEHIYQFAIEGWWATDIFSFLTGEPASYNIEALENSELMLIDKAGREKIFEQVPKFERFMRILIEKNVVANQVRLNGLMGQSAEARYLSFVKKYPQIVQRVPQHMIANYLGMTPETLSRVRKQLSTSG